MPANNVAVNARHLAGRDAVEISTVEHSTIIVPVDQDAS